MLVRSGVQGPDALEKAILGKVDPICLGGRIQRDGLPVSSCLHQDPCNRTFSVAP